mmetsp:Transcript_96535/g.166399  ORF Transcript_96535/g.166399 Transcript_96535/m.166399 type:complete len:204 (+) Transcript_96535:254-865(+)
MNVHALLVVSIGTRLCTAFRPFGDVLSCLGCAPVTGVRGVLRWRTRVRPRVGCGECGDAGGTNTSPPTRPHRCPSPLWSITRPVPARASLPRVQGTRGRPHLRLPLPTLRGPRAAKCMDTDVVVILNCGAEWDLTLMSERGGRWACFPSPPPCPTHSPSCISSCGSLPLHHPLQIACYPHVALASACLSHDAQHGNSTGHLAC